MISQNFYRILLKNSSKMDFFGISAQNTCRKLIPDEFFSRDMPLKFTEVNVINSVINYPNHNGFQRSAYFSEGT